jgi:DNA (cytosine-5)-methyltransferase 1
MLGEILQSDVDEKYYLNENAINKFKEFKEAKKIERIAATGHKYTFSEGGMAFPDALDKPGRTMLTSEGTVNRSSHVVKDPETKRLRILTPVECERLNGFPDHWTEGMSERMRYFCMGNALVVGLIERMAKRILEIEEEDAEAIKANPQQLQLSIY